MPDIRRDSQPEELLTLPAPDGFADSRRNSSNLPHELVFVFSYLITLNFLWAKFNKYFSTLHIKSRTFSFNSTTVESAVSKLNQQKLSPPNESSEPTQQTTPSDIPITVTPTTLDTSSTSDDTTIQDAMISPDTDSVPSGDLSPECPESKTSNGGPQIETPRGSCTNSIVSSDSMVSDSFVVKNSESEIGKGYLKQVQIQTE